MEMILLLVAMFAIMYFLMIRPQQKKMREDQEMRNQLAEGDRVLLTSGIFATIAHVGERQMIVELAPGLEVTILKGNVARKVTPEDEEFEFTDEVAPAVVADEYDGVADSLQPSDFLTEETRTSETTEATDPVTGEPVVEESVVEDDTSTYKPWDRTAGPSFEAPDETPRTEDNK